MTSNDILSKRIWETVVDFGMPPAIANLMVAQAKHETANFTSSVFKTNNNLYGYKYFAGAKYQLKGKGKLSPEGNSYAAYKSIEDSVKEVASWIRRHIRNYPKITKPADYAKALKSAGYYGDSVEHYAAGLQHYFKENMI